MGHTEWAPFCGALEKWGPHLGPTFWDQIWVPNLGPKFGPQIFAQIWSPIWVPTLGSIWCFICLMISVPYPEKGYYKNRWKFKTFFDGARLDWTGKAYPSHLSHTLATGRRARTSALPWVQQKGMEILIHFRRNPAGSCWAFGCNPAAPCAHHKAQS